MSDEDERARREKIARLKRAIVEGSYEVDPEAVAARMLAADALQRNPALDEETQEMEPAVDEGDETGKAPPAAGHEDTVSLSGEDAEATDERAPGDDGADKDDR